MLKYQLQLITAFTFVPFSMSNSGKQKSQIHRFFQIDDSKASSKCLTGGCRNPTVKVKDGSTTNMFRHLKDNHPTIYSNLQKEISEEKAKKTVKRKPSPASRQSTIETSFGGRPPTP